MAYQGLFVGLSLADLQDLQTSFKTCLKSIAVAGQSYSISGRQFTRADLKEVANLLSEVNQAIAALSPSSRVTRTYPNFNFGG